MSGGTKRARLVSKDNKTGKLLREDWRPVEEAELYLVRRKSLEGSRISWCTTSIEYEHDLPD